VRVLLCWLDWKAEPVGFARLAAMESDRFEDAIHLTCYLREPTPMATYVLLFIIEMLPLG
jgi:hypothetical protein